MTLNGVIALILLFITEFDSFADLLRHSDWRWTYIVCRISSSTLGQNWPALQRGLSTTDVRFRLTKKDDIYIQPADIFRTPKMRLRPGLGRERVLGVFRARGMWWLQMSFSDGELTALDLRGQFGAGERGGKGKEGGNGKEGKWQKGREKNPRN